MSRKRPPRRPSSRPRRRAAGRSGKVGYGKPPVEHQFRPGKSGNPKGRRKGSKNTQTLLREILDGKVGIRVGGEAQKISIREAILRRIVEDALKGNPKSAAFLFKGYDSIEANETFTDELNADDQAIINDFLNRRKHNEGEEQP